MSGSERIEVVRVFHDGSWKYKDDVGWTGLLPRPPRKPHPEIDPVGALLYRLYSWAYLCVRGGGYEGVDRRRNRPSAYYAEVTPETADIEDTDNDR